MNIIFLNRSGTHSKSYLFDGFRLSIVAFLMCFIPVFLGVFTGIGVVYFSKEQRLGVNVVPILSSMSEEEQRLYLLQERSDLELKGMMLKLATLQTRLMKMDALGKKLVEENGFESSEFTFSFSNSGMGGPYFAKEVDKISEAKKILSEFERQVDQKEQQLYTLNNLINNHAFFKGTFVYGKPVKKGWISSLYGERIDPFNGRVAWHDGVDFAGKMGSDIITVADGVVVWSGKRYGYGNLVEINHANGYKTRYAHCDLLKVEVGDIVERGDVIATIGNSGRSTGPHVHFEVRKDNKSIDPVTYIDRVY